MPVHHVPPDQAGARLDVVLARHVPAWSRSRLQAVIKAGSVTVDGAVCRRPGTPVEAGSAIGYELPQEAPPVTPEGTVVTALPVLHVDDQVLVVDKPAGVLSHANAHSQRGTVTHLAEAAFGPLPEGEEPGRPGLVHRLDRLTSGVMVLARSPQALEHLKAQFAAREVQKTYLAIVHHEPRFESEWVEAPIGRDPRNPERMRVAPDEDSGRAASSLVETRERFRAFTLVAVQPRTGRTHQVRVHLLHLGLPILGDRTYRHPGALRVPWPEDAPPVRRQALHAAELSFLHPTSGERLRFEAPVPEDMRAQLDWLRAHRAP